MTLLENLPTEILVLITRALQSLTSGPRYVLVPARLDYDPTADNEAGTIQRQISTNPKAQWQLTDPGPLYLALTCRKLREIYLSPAIASNLVLEIPPLPADKFIEKNHELRESLKSENLRGCLFARLRKWKAGSQGKPLTRFVLDSKWEGHGFFSQMLCAEIWEDILSPVGEIFGDELRVVVVSQGDHVQSDFRLLSPRRFMILEEMDRSFYVPNISDPKTSSSTDKASGEQGIPHSIIAGNETMIFRNESHHIDVVPLSSTTTSTCLQLTSAPLSLHVYFGYGQFRADYLISYALEAFSNSNLQSFFYSSDPNNLHMQGHSRSPAQGQQLNEKRNPWAPLLPAQSDAYRTLQELTLDCALFWSEIAHFLPHMQELRRLDVELTLLHSEPMYPFKLLTKVEAEQKILDTCLSKETMKNEQNFEGNREKKWVAIRREDISLPWIDPEVREMPINPQGRRFMSVDEKVCSQIMDRRIQRLVNM